MIPDGRRIDFMVAGAAENTYIEVKTVSAQAKGTEAAWNKYLKRRELHTEHTYYVVDKQWMGAQLYGNSFSGGHFLDYARQFETRLAAAIAVRPGRGVLALRCKQG